MTLTPTRAASTYQTVEVTSRSPLELVVMLYDGALAAMTQARDALARGDHLAKAPALSKALTIVHALQSTLDMDAGREVAAQLDALYSYVSERLTEANIRQDPALIDEAVRVFVTLREAWGQVAAAPISQAS